MKRTRVQTLGELRMRHTANWWAGLSVCVSPASSSRRVWHGLATVVDSVRESIHALRCDLLCLQDTQSERTWSKSRSRSAVPRISNAYNIQLIDGLGHATQPATVPVYRSQTQSFQENRLIIFQVCVVLKTLVSLTDRLEPCSARIAE